MVAHGGLSGMEGESLVLCTKSDSLDSLRSLTSKKDSEHSVCNIDIDVDVSGDVGTEGGETQNRMVTVSSFGSQQQVAVGGRKNQYWPLSLRVTL